MSSYSLWIGGHPATEIAPHSPPTWETLADGGCGEASWAFAASVTMQHQALRPGAVVTIQCGAHPTYLGRLVDVDRTTGECKARGLFSDAYGIPALHLGAATRDISLALSGALAPPWNWRVAGLDGVSGTAFGDSDEPMMVGHLMDELAEQHGRRWGQDARGVLYLRSDPTTPAWMIAPGEAAFGSSSEDTATHLVGRYQQAGTGINATVAVGDNSAPFPRAEMVDLTARGALTPFDAVAILTQALRATRIPATWTNGVTLTADQIMTMGGAPAGLATVRAGQMVRVTGIPTAQQIEVQAPWLDVVIGKTSYTAGEKTIYIEPVKVAPRNLTDVLAAA